MVRKTSWLDIKISKKIFYCVKLCRYFSSIQNQQSELLTSSVNDKLVAETNVYHTVKIIQRKIIVIIVHFGTVELVQNF